MRHDEKGHVLRDVLHIRTRFAGNALRQPRPLIPHIQTVSKEKMDQVREAVMFAPDL